jgi:RES domain-containing protein
LSVTAWRITKRKYKDAAFTGAGARKYGGRWNSPGTAIVYTAETQSLAILEMLVHLETPDLLPEYVLIGVEIDESLVRELDRSKLPRNWRAQPAPLELRKFGDEWLAAGNSAVLRVPSALVPGESNFLVNPAHPDFSKLTIRDAISFALDERLAR